MTRRNQSFQPPQQHLSDVLSAPSPAVGCPESAGRRRRSAPEEWNGHLPATQVVLEQILIRASSDAWDFNRHERLFAHACELRCQIATGEWHARIGIDFHELGAARYILGELGAETLSEDLARTIDRMRSSRSRQSQKALLRYLEKRLAAEGPMLDSLLARYADELATHAGSPGVSG